MEMSESGERTLAMERLAASNAEQARRARAWESLGETISLLRRCQTPAEFTATAAAVLPRVFAGTPGLFAVFDPAASVLSVAAVWEWPPGAPHAPRFTPEECLGLSGGGMHVVDAPPCCRCAHVGSREPAAYLCAPVFAHGELYGLLHVGRFGGGPLDLDGGLLRLARGAIESMELALDNLRLRQSARDQSARDLMTGLYNRRYASESLERELARARRESRAVGIILMRVDGLGRLRESAGPQAGDALLQALADVLRDGVRLSDVVSRWSDDEFLLVMPGAASHATRQRARALRAAFERLAVQAGGLAPQAVPQAVLSVGMAAFPEQGATARDLLRLAGDFQNAAALREA
jgi:diguanylate cyclase (GGDEF)-like protein